MTRKVLLDANLLIAAFDSNGTTSEEMKTQAREKLTALLSDPDALIFITPLVRYEVLRGIDWHDRDSFLTMQSTLNEFPDLDITRDISELSANLFRLDTNITQQNNDKRNVDKRRFDVFHFCSAWCNSLELCSNDTDIAKIASLHTTYQQLIAS